MIVLPRKKGESIVIDDDIILTVIEIRGDKVRLGLNVPRESQFTGRRSTKRSAEWSRERAHCEGNEGRVVGVSPGRASLP